MSRASRKYIIKKGSKHLISKFQTIHSSKFLVNKQKGDKGYNDDFMPHASTKTTTCCCVLNTHTDANLTDGSVNLYRSLGHTATRDYDLAMLIVIRRWILDEIFIDTDFLVSLLVSESEYFRRRKGLFRNSVTRWFYSRDSGPTPLLIVSGKSTKTSY